MRSVLLSVLVVLASGALASAAPAQPVQPAKPATNAIPVSERARIQPHPSFTRCCKEKVWDAHGHELGDLIEYDARYGPQPLVGFVAYHLKGGDAVALSVNPEVIAGLQPPGGSVALFTTPDCSGNTMYVALSWPPLAKRYAMVLPVGPGGYPQTATQAWLWATDPLPARALPPAGTVFHSQWGDNMSCQPYPAPGYTVMGSYGGYWMHRVEDLYAKFTRPFYIDY